jgi:glycosyltransferase involved in cell wall biosynthesis
MDERIALSIIIPVYNTAKYIQKCFDSLQDLEVIGCKYEVLLINDGSTDNSIEIINSIALSNANVIVISHENQGLSGTRNVGINNAKGEYVLFLDSDDWLNGTVIAKLLTQVKKDNLDLLSYGLEFFDENNKSLGVREKHPLVYEQIISGKEALIQGYQPSSSCLFLYKTDFLKDNKLYFYPKIAQQDIEFTTRIMILAKTLYFSSEIGYNYYRHSGTISIPKSKEKLKKYLSDSIIVATQMKKNKSVLDCKEKNLILAIEKNYNSVVWNLLYRLFTKPHETDLIFIKECLANLKAENLYPIKGSLKTNFQRFTMFFFNIENLFIGYIKMK